LRHIVGVEPLGPLAAQEPAYEGIVTGGAAYVVEEAAYFGLEDDDYGQCSYVKYGAEQGGDHAHIQRSGEYPHQKKDYDGDEDIHSRRTLYPAENHEYNRRYEYDVDKVDKREMQKFHMSYVVRFPVPIITALPALLS
jgi:hypothetical protein